MISVVIPFYNEEERLKSSFSPSINQLINILSTPSELVFINDGSTDGTLKMLKTIKKKFSSFPIKVLSYQKNQGKGYAVRTGLLKARGNKIIVMDADFSIDLSEIPKFLKKLSEYDLVVGSKKHLYTRTLKKQKIPRRILGKGFTLLTDFLLGLNFSDITCGFKAFRGLAAQKIFSRQRMNRWSYDAETLYLAKKLNFTILELPVKWHHVEGSKVSPLLDTVRSLRDLAFIVMNHRLGKYD